MVTWNWLVAARWIFFLHLPLHMYLLLLTDVEVAHYNPNTALWYLLLPPISEALALYSAASLVDPCNLRGGSERMIQGAALWLGIPM